MGCRARCWSGMGFVVLALGVVAAPARGDLIPFRPGDTLQDTLHYAPGGADNSLQVVGDQWANYNFTLDWSVTWDPDGPSTHPVHYSYSIAIDSGSAGGDLTRSISHILAQVTPEATEADFLFSGGPLTVGTEGAGSPGLHTPSMWAVKLEADHLIPEFEGSSFEFNWSFWSSRLPEWGDFYFKGGGAGTLNYAINDPGYLVARPNGIVPEPSSIAMLTGCALMGLLAFYVRRRRRQPAVVTQ